MFASLPMYDLPEIRPSTDALWKLIKARFTDHGIEDFPPDLTRDSDPHADWLRDDLILSQTCGLPFVRELQGKVQLLGSPSYDIECGSGSYYSVIVAGRNTDGSLANLSAGRLACNDLRSQSGFAAILSQLHKEDAQLPSAITISGSHLHSIVTVARGEADYAAIDAVTWALAERHLSLATQVRIIAATGPMPCLPYITSLAHGPKADAMRQATSEAIAGLSEKDRDALLLTGFVGRQEADYEPLADAWSMLEDVGVVRNVTALANQAL